MTARAARLALLPLDERPACTALPADLASIAGAELALPDPELLPRYRDPAHHGPHALGAWLLTQGQEADAVVVSLEGLALAGLIGSRIGNESPEVVQARWEVLREVRCPVYGSVVVPRSPAVDDAAEEPAYWAHHGRALSALSESLGFGVESTPVARIPQEVRRDWTRRRLRQHLLALRAVGLVAEGTLEALVVGLDDGSATNLSAAEAVEIRSWVGRLGVQDRVQVRGGTDESAGTLVVHALARHHALSPSVSVVSAQDLALVPTYESADVRTSAREHVLGCGGTPWEPDKSGGGPIDRVGPSAIVVVHGPQGPGDWALSPPRSTDPVRAAQTVDLVVRSLESGVPVSVCDVAHPNGADPLLIDALADRRVLTRLSGFAAWNTAGNSLGTAIAAAVVRVVGEHAGTFDPQAMQRFVAHRVVEDWGWMSQVRPWLRQTLALDPLRHDHVPAGTPALADAEARLAALVAATPGLDRWRLAAPGIQLPWSRTFEVDLRLEAVDG